MELALALAQIAAAIFEVAQKTVDANAKSEAERLEQLGKLDDVLAQKLARGPIPPIPPADPADTTP